MFIHFFRLCPLIIGILAVFHPIAIAEPVDKNQDLTLPHLLPPLAPPSSPKSVSKTELDPGFSNIEETQLSAPCCDNDVQYILTESSTKFNEEGLKDDEIDYNKVPPNISEVNQENFSLKIDQNSILKSPLLELPGVASTANQLKEGEVIFNFYNRLYFIPNSVDRNATAAYPSGGFSWGITDSLEISLQFQVVDTGLPYRQGDFRVNTISDINSGRGEVMIEAQQKIWESESKTEVFAGIFSVDFADANFRFRDINTGQILSQDNRTTVVPALKFPFTAKVADKWQFTLSPTAIFYPESSALFFFRAPIENPGSFGTNFGFTGAISYEFNERTVIWADGFAPFTGNNSINRDSGRTTQVVAYNTGIRYLVNPRLSLDVFATNTLGQTGALALTADPDFMALGVGLNFMPNFIGGNRKYPDSFNPEFVGKDSVIRGYGLGLMERTNLNSEKFNFTVLGGGNGILSNLSYSFVKDLELGVYLDYVFSSIDESEQGISGKVRLLNQAENAPVTFSLGVTLGQTNEPFVNFNTDNRNTYNERGLDRTVPSVFETDQLFEGRLKIFTFSAPVNYEFDSGAALWLTPIIGYVQRQGTQIAGFNAGGLLPLTSDFSLLGEVGYNFSGDGNAFIGESLQDATPWNIAVRWNWNPLSALGLYRKDDKIRPHLELYVTNRVGFTPWLQMRVRDDNNPTVGAGIFIPF